MDYNWVSEMYKRYRMGDPISDQDLARSINFLDDLIPKVRAFGDTSRLFSNELMYMREAFVGYKNARLR